MNSKSHTFLIGFDRYVQLSWCSAALEVAVGDRAIDEAKEEIARVLTGNESRRKTFDILKRLWISPLEKNAGFVSRGVTLYQAVGPSTLGPLSWGSALVTYPFFGHVSEITGRLISLQGDCSVKEVQRRIAEIFGERDSVSRAVSRVLQSQENWGMIARVDKGKRLVRLPSLVLKNEQLVAWLVEAALRYQRKAISLGSLQSLAVLYPFVLDQPLGYLMSNSPMLEVRSEGPSNQFVSLRESN